MSILFPTSNATREEKYKKAWHDLLDIHADADTRAHSKCWLTYRAIDGEIKLEDWDNKIDRVVIPRSLKNRVRWCSSINASAFFMNTLHGRVELAEFNRAAMWDLGPIEEHPDSIKNHIRLESIQAERMLSQGRHLEAGGIAWTAIERWKSVMGSFDWVANSLRFVEMFSEIPTLHHLVMTYRESGAYGSGMIHDLEWANKHITNHINTPWGRCIQKVKSK
jgi:hypothetical protein